MPVIAADDNAAEHSEVAGGSAGGDGFEPAQEEWLNNDLGSRAEIEQTLDTGLDNVFSEEPAEAAARTAQDAAPEICHGRFQRGHFGLVRRGRRHCADWHLP
jgi:hypothetical protein